MGLIISRFRKKETTIEILEGIDKEISRLQKNRKDNQDRQKRIATSLLIYSFILYVLSALIFFFLYFPDTWSLRLLYSLPLLAFPFLIWGVKKLLHWYFVKRIHANDLALRDLRERKKQILEDVMETETYKKAKEILEKFDPARFRKLETNEAVSSSGGISPTSVAPGLHQRKPVSQPATPRTQPRPIPPLTTAQKPIGARTPNPFINTPLRAPTPTVRVPVPVTSATGPRQQSMQQATQRQLSASVPNSPAQMIRGPAMGRGYVVPPGPPMPRSVLPRERGTMDRLVDYLVGDGPENRYALICTHCHSHNGMALKEEFEYMSFRCCYCYGFNPARRQRPMAPRLEFFTPRPTVTKLEEKLDESDEDDEEEEEGDHKESGDTKRGGIEGTVPASVTALSSSPKPAVRASAHGQQSSDRDRSMNSKGPSQSSSLESESSYKGFQQAINSNGNATIETSSSARDFGDDFPLVDDTQPPSGTADLKQRENTPGTESENVLEESSSSSADDCVKTVNSVNPNLAHLKDAMAVGPEERRGAD